MLNYAFHEASYFTKSNKNTNSLNGSEIEKMF